MADRAVLAGQLGQSRLDLLEVLTRVPDDAWGPGQWGVREVLAHLAAWDTASATTVNALRVGQPTPPVVVDEDAFNRAAVEEVAALSPQQVMVRLHMARAQLVAAVSQAGDLGEFQFPWDDRGTLERMVRGLVYHEREHTAEVRAQYGRDAG